MENYSLNELYTLATGMRPANIEEQIEAVKLMSADEKMNFVGRLLWTIPGGRHNAYWVERFKTALFAALDGDIELVDTDADGVIESVEVQELLDEPADLDGDGDVDENDEFLAAILSTAEVTTNEDADE